jgi:hypothetical protein
MLHYKAILTAYIPAERDPSKRPTIPELKRHAWLVPPKFGLDAYNILVMVSKVRTLHRENPERSDEELKEHLITLMTSAGLALPPASTPVPAPAAKPASAPPPPPPQPKTGGGGVAPPPPPPPPPAAALASKAPAGVPGGAIASAAAAAANRRAIAAENGENIAPAGGTAKAAVGGSAGGLNMQEVLAQRNKLRKVEKPAEAVEQPKKGELEVKGLIKHGLDHIRQRVADDTGTFSNGNGSDFTSEFTSEVDHR